MDKHIEKFKCISRNLSINNESYIRMYIEDWNKIYRSKIFDQLVIRI